MSPADRPDQDAPPLLHLDRTRRVVVVDLEPVGDEPGTVGLLAAAAAAGLDTAVVVVPGGAGPDEDDLVARIVDVVGEEGEGTLLVAPWRRSGHPAHEALGAAAAAAARRTDATLVELPDRWWDPTRTADLPPGSSRRSPLTAVPGGAPVPGVVVVEPVTDGRLDRLHRDDPDPWGVDRRWYERRKRELLLAMLPRPHYDAVLDLGCSTGALTEALAARAGHVTALDASGVAVEAARRRLAERIRAGTVRVEQAELPHEWPEGRADLVVVSELGYFLTPAGLRALVDRAVESLAPDGELVLCHWSHEVRGWPLDGPRVHELVGRWWPHPVQGRYADRDVEILVLGPDAGWPQPTR